MSQPPKQIEAPPIGGVAQDEVLEWIREELDPNGVTVIMLKGPPGIGKRTLTRMVADALGDYFPGGHLAFEYVHGLREDSRAALEEGLRSLGAHPYWMAGTQLSRGNFLTHTHDKRLLVVIEGAWDSGQVRELLPSGRGSLVLVVADSRAGDHSAEIIASDLDLYSGGVKVLDLRPLEIDGVRTLLTRRAGWNLENEQALAVEELFGLCAGSPLAASLAGAQLRLRGRGSARVLAADAINALITREPEAGLGMRLPGQPHLGLVRVENNPLLALEVMLDVAYQNLSAEGAALYRALSAWPGPSCPQAAVRSISLPTAAEELVDAGLAEVDAGSLRFRHGCVRTHAQGQAGAAHEHPTRTLSRMLDAYLPVLACAYRAAGVGGMRVVDLGALSAGAEDPFQGDPEAAHWWLSRERDNLHAVVVRSAELGLDDHAWMTADLATDLYEEQGPWHLWCAAGQTGAEAARRIGHVPAEAVLASSTSLALNDFGRLDEATKLAEHAVELAEQVEDPLLAGWAWECYAKPLERRLDRPAAIAAYDQAVEHYEASSQPVAAPRAALSVLCRGIARSREGEHARAIADTEQARRRWLDLPDGPDRYNAALALRVKSQVQEAAGDHQSAVEILHAAERELAEAQEV